MTLAIQTLRVEGYRGFRKLEVGPFGRVNLITGKNNAGKSSLLEVIRLVTSGASQATLDSIVINREEAETYYKIPPDAPEPEPVLAGTFPYSGLFSGFPDIEHCREPIRIGASVDPPELEIRLKKIANSNQPIPGPALPYLEVSLHGQTQYLAILDRLQPRIHEASEGYVYLDPAGSRSTFQQARWWDAIALRAEEAQVVEALRIVAPDIDAVRVIGRPSSGLRTAIAKSRNYREPVPLKSLGDGVNRIFGIALSLARAKNAVLLIDEFENGLHHSILPDVWKVVFRMAAELDAQVFATTHSWDCITAFQQAAGEHPEEGVLARLTVRNGEVLPTLFREDELRIAARDSIELR